MPPARNSIPTCPDLQIPPSHPPLGFVKHLSDPLTGLPQTLRQPKTHFVAETSSERGRNLPRVTKHGAAESGSTPCFSHFPGSFPESQGGFRGGCAPAQSPRHLPAEPTKPQSSADAARPQESLGKLCRKQLPGGVGSGKDPQLRTPWPQPPP